MLPQPTIANRSGRSGMIPRPRCQLRLDQAAHPDHLVGRIPVVRLVLDGQRAEIARVEELVDAVGDPGDALAVHARDVGSLRLDVLQVDEEEPLAEIADRLHRVVALRRPPAGVDGRSEHVLGIADQLEDLLRALLRWFS